MPSINTPEWFDTTDVALAQALNDFWTSHKNFIIHEVMPYMDMYFFGGELNWLLMTNQEFRKEFIKNPDKIRLKINDKNRLEWVQ